MVAAMLLAPKITEQGIQDRVLHRDGLILIIDKPAGLPVHAGPNGGPNLEYYFKWLQFGLLNPPALAHRLDRDTSGCLVLGRHRKALRKMGELFRTGRVKKTYWAVCVGAPETDTGVCSLPLRKRSDNKTSWWMEVCEADAEGVMASETSWKVLAKNDQFSLVEFSPHTGRTHQIRVHAAALGCPLLGEPVYGEMEKMFRSVPIHLHARSIEVPLGNKPAIVATAPVPQHFQTTLDEEGLNPSPNQQT
jgi:tRNA pseudouridine32 synthase / 23S rRNA pseudouridine746 synthase